MPFTKSIMVVGTHSNSGKSLFVAGLSYLLRQNHFRVAPFKAQNMSLNAAVTPEGGEIGRAQAVQAEACGIPPSVLMNPILLKPVQEEKSQVIVLGKNTGNFSVSEYYHNISFYRDIAREAYRQLIENYDVVVLEGAGSPAEINLMEKDIVNLSMAEYAGADVILIADIERGGVFASIYGTVELLPKKWKSLIKGIVINKFRGDIRLLTKGMEEMEERTNIPILGVLPFLPHVHLEEEDSLNLKSSEFNSAVLIDIVVLRCPYISNFTDFHQFKYAKNINLRFVRDLSEVGNPDLLILPGSKNVIRDLQYLKEKGFVHYLKTAHQRDLPILGICGGFQMLGKTIRDPYGVEEGMGEGDGLGLIPMTTVLDKKKIQQKTSVFNRGLPFLKENVKLEGYEIHCGISTIEKPSPLFTLGCTEGSLEGYAHPAKNLWGTYLHGLFDSQETVKDLCRWLLERKGMGSFPLEFSSSLNAFEDIADAIRKHINLSPLGLREMF